MNSHDQHNHADVSRKFAGTGSRGWIRTLPAAILVVVLATGCGGPDADAEPAPSIPPGSSPESGEMSTTGPSAADSRAPDIGEGGDAAVDHGEEPQPGGHLAEVHLGVERASSLGVRVRPVAGGSARSVVQRPATLVMDPDRRALVGPRIESKVVRVLVDLGERVEEGQGLAVLSSVELGRTRAELLTARARLRTREAAYEREQSLFEKQISSEAELLEAEARYEQARSELEASREALRLFGFAPTDIDRIEAGGEAPLSEFVLRSPLAGRVQQRDLSPGQTVSPGETPIHVADVSRLWAMIEAYDQDIPLLESGRPVELTVRSLPDRTFEGEVDWVSYELDPETRTLAVRAVVDNPDQVLRAGMYGTARMQLATEARLAVLPVDAVQSLEGTSVVFVPAEEEGAFRPVEVVLGEESQDGWVEILSGLVPGDSAVVEGAFDVMSAATSGTRSAAHSH